VHYEGDLAAHVCHCGRRPVSNLRSTVRAAPAP
jgi:hypothetical protein